jgi:Tfp pilus assembly protein PilF
LNNRLESLLNLHKKKPDDSFLIYGIALEYMSTKNFDEAEKYFETLLLKDSKYVPAYMQYAQLKEKQDQIERAKSLYRKGIEIAKETGEAHAAKEMEEFLDELE